MSNKNPRAYRCGRTRKLTLVANCLESPTPLGLTWYLPMSGCGFCVFATSVKVRADLSWQTVPWSAVSFRGLLMLMPLAACLKTYPLCDIAGCLAALRLGGRAGLVCGPRRPVPLCRGVHHSALLSRSWRKKSSRSCISESREIPVAA